MAAGVCSLLHHHLAEPVSPLPHAMLRSYKLFIRSSRAYKFTSPLSPPSPGKELKCILSVNIHYSGGEFTKRYSHHAI